MFRHVLLIAACWKVSVAALPLRHKHNRTAKSAKREPHDYLQSHFHHHHLDVPNSELAFQGHQNQTEQMMEAVTKEELWNPSSHRNVRREPMKIVTEMTEGFVRVRTLQGDKQTKYEVEVAAPTTIVYVFLIMYVPILVGWASYFYNGRQERLYILLLPITLCLTLVGDNFVQKSLAVLMQAPMAITSAQAGAMGILGAAWAAIERKPMNMQECWWPLIMWGTVAFMFTAYQLLNHLVAYYCSLAERTVFTNLCPVVSLIFEATVMPANLRASPTFRSKLALAFLVIGAVTFSIQYPDFTTMGIIFASMMVVAVVPYRLAQRYTLNEAKLLPVMLLVCYDGFFLMTPSTAIAAAETKHYLQTWEGWMSDSSIPLLLLLSILTFTANHACALLVLQMSSATVLQVYQNLSNFIVVGLGICFFGDNVLSSPLVLVGLLICLCSGLWYAIEVQPKAVSDKTKEVPGAEKALTAKLGKS